MGPAPVARDVRADDSGRSTDEHHEGPDVDSERRVGRVEHHGKRSARVGRRDKTERGCEGNDSGHVGTPCRSSLTGPEYSSSSRAKALISVGGCTRLAFRLRLGAATVVVGWVVSKYVM